MNTKLSWSLVACAAVAYLLCICNLVTHGNTSLIETFLTDLFVSSFFIIFGLMLAKGEEAKKASGFGRLTGWYIVLFSFATPVVSCFATFLGLPYASPSPFSLTLALLVVICISINHKIETNQQKASEDYRALRAALARNKFALKKEHLKSEAWILAAQETLKRFESKDAAPAQEIISALMENRDLIYRRLFEESKTNKRPNKQT